MMRTIGFVLLGIFLAPGSVIAADACSQAEGRYFEAIDSYKKGDASKFMEALLKDGPLEGDKRSLTQKQALEQIEQFFGSIQSGSVLSKKLLGERTCYLAVVLEFESGPGFALVTYYRGNKGVSATSMSFRTEPEDIFPASVLIE